MAIAWGAQGRETDEPCTGQCEVNSASMERLCVGGAGCCGELIGSTGQTFAATCTERSTKLLVFGCVLIGMCVLSVFAAACLYSCYWSDGPAEAAGAAAAAPDTLGRPSPQDAVFDPSEVRVPVAASPDHPARTAAAAPAHGLQRPHVRSAAAVRQESEAARRGAASIIPPLPHPHCADALLVSHDARKEIDGRYVRCARLLHEFPVFEALDGRVIAATKDGAWAFFDAEGEVLAQSVAHCGRMPHELTEPMVWQGYLPATELWEALPKLKIVEGYTETSRVEVRLDDLDAEVVRWVGCQILNVLSSGSSYQIKVLPTTRYNHAEGYSGVTLEDPVSGELLRRRSAAAVLSPTRSPHRGAPRFEAKHINVKSPHSGHYTRVTIVNHVEAAEAAGAIAAKLHNGAAPPRPAEAEGAQFVLVKEPSQEVAQVRYDEVAENACYVLKEVTAAEYAALKAKQAGAKAKAEEDVRQAELITSPPAPAPAPAADIRTPTSLRSTYEKLRSSQGRRRAAAAAADAAPAKPPSPALQPPPSPAAANNVGRGLGDEFSERSATPQGHPQKPGQRAEVLSLQAKIMNFKNRTSAASGGAPQ
eukprot:TRINITY_DN6132_c1_g2_i1.p1 TRINITY_DN6132_c1_g2~~TRINITY_DN6132_c1_g2_i1.p1  ORF type:complete len:677 (+),score=247.77 TRINITY_DN6132_c1_g2_i1:260-2032(+)